MQTGQVWEKLCTYFQLFIKEIAVMIEVSRLQADILICFYRTGFPSQPLWRGLYTHFILLQ